MGTAKTLTEARTTPTPTGTLQLEKMTKKNKKTQKPETKQTPTQLPTSMCQNLSQLCSIHTHCSCVTQLPRPDGSPSSTTANKYLPGQCFRTQENHPPRQKPNSQVFLSILKPENINFNLP